MPRIAIIGGGAAGFFLAVSLKERVPDAYVCIYEKARKVLAKVEVSSGGRCNCTNSFEDVKDLKSVYPRGDKLMKRLFKTFDYEDAYRWFEDHGVALTTQDDQCVFPKSQDSHTIINCFTSCAQKLGVRVKLSCACTGISPEESGGFSLSFKTEDGEFSDRYDKVVVTTGGSPQRKGLDWLERLGHTISDPVPSLFTFNIKSASLRQLMGAVVENASASIPGTKLRSSGPLLITHWGMSGPAILRLSSYAARHLAESDYRSPLIVNWTGESNTDSVIEHIGRMAEEGGQKHLSSVRPYGIPQRLWDYLIEKCELKRDKRWGELGRKGVNRIANQLTNDSYTIEGKSAFREEFVTCGGVSLSSVNMSTLESKHCPGLYFAGEVLDIDAVTGGFNFQAAWTTAHTVAQNII
jgi:predicted Rossmann fold flavoprotein